MKRKLFLCVFIVFTQSAMAHPIEILTEQEFIENEVFHFESETDVLRSCAVLPLGELKEHSECDEFASSLIGAKNTYAKFQKALDSGVQLSQDNLNSFQSAIETDGGLSEKNRYAYQNIYMSMLIGTYENQSSHK